MAAMHRPEQVELHGPRPHRRDVDLAERRIGADRSARAVEQDVEPAELLLGRGNRCRDTGRIGHVGMHEQRASGCLRLRVSAGLNVDIGDHDPRALAREQQGAARPIPARRR